MQYSKYTRELVFEEQSHLKSTTNVIPKNICVPGWCVEPGRPPAPGKKKNCKGFICCLSQLVLAAGSIYTTSGGFSCCYLQTKRFFRG